MIEFHYPAWKLQQTSPGYLYRYTWSEPIASKQWRRDKLTTNYDRMTTWFKRTVVGCLLLLMTTSSGRCPTRTHATHAVDPIYQSDLAACGGVCLRDKTISFTACACAGIDRQYRLIESHRGELLREAILCDWRRIALQYQLSPFTELHIQVLYRCYVFSDCFNAIGQFIEFALTAQPA